MATRKRISWTMATLRLHNEKIQHRSWCWIFCRDRPPDGPLFRIEAIICPHIGILVYICPYFLIILFTTNNVVVGTVLPNIASIFLVAKSLECAYETGYLGIIRLANICNVRSDLNEKMNVIRHNYVFIQNKAIVKMTHIL